jgi:hypothetical protein
MILFSANLDHIKKVTVLSCNCSVLQSHTCILFIIQAFYALTNSYIPGEFVIQVTGSHKHNVMIGGNSPK